MLKNCEFNPQKAPEVFRIELQEFELLLRVLNQLFYRTSVCTIRKWPLGGAPESVSSQAEVEKCGEILCLFVRIVSKYWSRSEIRFGQEL